MGCQHHYMVIGPMGRLLCPMSQKHESTQDWEGLDLLGYMKTQLLPQAEGRTMRELRVETCGLSRKAKGLPQNPCKAPLSVWQKHQENRPG